MAKHTEEYLDSAKRKYELVGGPIYPTVQSLIAEIHRLRVEKAELVAALRDTANSCTKQNQKSQTVIAARAILARHDGKGAK